MQKILKAKKATPEEVGVFLQGSDPQEHIIKIECGYTDRQATIIYRDKDFNKFISKQDFYPFCWAKQEAGRQMFGGKREILKLELQAAGIGCRALLIANENGEVHPRMENGYRVLFYALEPMSYNNFIKFFEKTGVPLKPKPGHWSEQKKYYKSVAPHEQFMISTGKRLFKGYESYDDLLRMQFDIETSSLDPKTGMIDQIGYRTNKGFEKIITIGGDTPEEYYENAYNSMIEFYDDIAQVNPDVISGYNSENFDWNFFDVFSQVHYNQTLADMSKRPNLPNGIYKKKQSTVLKLGGEMEYYKPTIIWGKHNTDALFSVRRAQALDSNMKKANLKYITKYSKINKPNRVYVPGDLIHDTWSDEEEHYAFNDDNGKWFKLTDEVLNLHYYETKIVNTEEVTETIHGKTVVNENYYNTYIKDRETFIGTHSDFKGKECTIINVDINKEVYTIFFNYEQVYKHDIKEEVDLGLKYSFTQNQVIDNENGDVYELKNGRYIVQRYLLDDLWETDKVELQYNESNFLVTKMLPVNFERTCTMGTATIWKYLMLAWSYENNLAIPEGVNRRSFTGGLSRLLTVGFIPNVLKLDYNSMYPSIELTEKITTPVDISGAMPAMLDYVLTNREKYKELKGKFNKEADKVNEEKKEFIKLLRELPEYVSLSDSEFGKVVGKHPKVIGYTTLYHANKAEAQRNDKLQLPLKITANAFFGSFGAGGEVFNWSDMDCAEETTCCGRQMLRLMLYWFTKKGYQGIVCDSVTGDTPLFIRYRQNNTIDIKPIESLFGLNQQNVEVLEDGREYDYNDCLYDVLCRSGWQKPKFLYRHKTDKDVYRVEDNDMSVDCTKDHSLFNDKQEEIKPTEIKEDTKLEYYKGETIYTDFNTQCVNENYIKFIANTVKNGICTELPVTILNLDIKGKKLFLSLLNNIDININTHTKTLVAGIQYIQNCIKNN